MRQTGRWLLVGTVAVGVLILAAMATLLVPPRLETLVESTIETYSKAVTGTTADIDGVDLSLSTASGRIVGFTIGNPSSYQSEYALKIDAIELTIRPESLNADTLVVERAQVSGARLNAEQHSNSSNLSEILEHMQTGGEASSDEGRIIIDRFRLDGAQLILTSESLSKPETLELRPVTLTGLGRETGGLTYGQATDTILSAILMAARAAAGERLGHAARHAVTRELEEELRERAQDLLE
jgi:hypothetical protein